MGYFVYLLGGSIGHLEDLLASFLSCCLVPATF